MIKRVLVLLCLTFTVITGLSCTEASAENIGADERAELMQTLGIYSADDDTLIIRGAFISSVIRSYKSRKLELYGGNGCIMTVRKIILGIRRIVFWVKEILSDMN